MYTWVVCGVGPEWFTLARVLAAWTWWPQGATRVIVFLALHGAPWGAWLWFRGQCPSCPSLTCSMQMLFTGIGSSPAPPHPCPCSLPHSPWSPGGSFAPYQTPEPIAVGLKARYAPVQAHGERAWVCDNEECSQAITRDYPGRCHILIHMGEQLFILPRVVVIKNSTQRNSLVLQWLGLCALTAEGLGSVHG